MKLKSLTGTTAQTPARTIMTTAGRAIAVTSAVLLILAGCDSNDNSASSSLPAFSGTVSTTKGIATATVEMKTPDGTILDAVVDDSGQYSLDQVTTNDGYLMRVSLGNGNYLYSIAHIDDVTANRQNIHSYTDLVARTWFADQRRNIDSVFASSAGIENFPTAEVINTIDANVQAIVSDVLEVYGLSGTNLSTASYQAIDTGVDRFLNENPVIIKNNRATIIVNDPQTNLQTVAVNRVALQTTFGENDTTPPEQPQNLRALGANTEGNLSIVLSWTTARDNIGVATYEIYRNDILIDHTPFPIYRDTNVAPATNYIYKVITRDESNNRSAPSVNAVGSALTEPRNTLPVPASSATLEASTDSVDVYWAHDNLLDLARFEVTRTSVDGILVREVTSANLSDITVASGTEYCYSIVAVDASNNRSESNRRSCITTSGAAIDTEDSNVIPSTVGMAQESISGLENTIISAFVNRIGEPDGEISIDYTVTPGTAIADEDYLVSDGTLVWTDGDSTAKQIDIQLLGDGIVEGPETLAITLTNSSTDAVIADSITSVTIVDID